MSELFSSKEIAAIQERYNRYISTKLRVKLKAVTYDQYAAITGDFLRNIVLNRVPVDNYTSIFSNENIESFRKMRKSVIARSALQHLLNMFVSEGQIVKGFEFEFPLPEKIAQPVEFMTFDDIKYIFDECVYKDHAEKIVTKAICALSAFCFFEQKHIKALRLQDVDGNLIRNVRIDYLSEKETHLVRWIKLNDLTAQCLDDYLTNYRGTLDNPTDSLFVINSATTINNYLSAFKRTVNKQHLSNSIDTNKMVASYILYWLIATSGRAIAPLSQIIEGGNAQLRKAFRYYMLNYSEAANNSGTVSIEEFTRIEQEFRSVEKALSDDPDEFEPAEMWIDIVDNKLMGYSMEVDLQMEDLVNFDAFSTQNLESKSVVINRLVRDTAISRKLKGLYENKCQFCGIQLRSANGDFMSEAHHLRPYNKTHQGDDTFHNLIVLCPNCHAQFDQLFYAIDPETNLVNCLFDDDLFHPKRLEMKTEHIIGKAYLNYVWKLFLEKKALLTQTSSVD